MKSTGGHTRSAQRRAPLRRPSIRFPYPTRPTLCGIGSGFSRINLGLGADRYRTIPSLFALGVEVLDMPVPLGVLQEAAQVIDEHASAVAEGLSNVFKRGIWEPFRQGELDQVDQEHLAAVVARLRPLAVQGLVSAFERAAERAIRQSTSG